MKYLSFLCLLLAFPMLSLSAQDKGENCYYGITFEVSDNPSWGYGELIITSVDANSKSERLGLKKGDIILEINGNTTYLRDSETILKWLQSPKVELLVRNMKDYSKRYNLDRICLPKNSIDEKGLADIFCFYSLENASTRSFVLPIEVAPNTNVDFSEYHTFDFSKEEKNAFDRKIQNIIESELLKKGLKKSLKDPDMVIQTYYSLMPNENAGATQSLDNKFDWRYDNNSRQMVKLPVFLPNDTTKTSLATDLASLGVTFYDRKYILKGELTQIWDAHIRDYISTSKYSFDGYLKVNLPLLLIQYPYSTAKKDILYTVHQAKYNYTGLNFDSEDFSHIVMVDANSPASLAGLRAGDIVESINGKELLYSKAMLTDGYRAFIKATLKYRDKKTAFICANGYTNCMYWNKERESEVKQAFNNEKYMTTFAYLFNFESYINGGKGNILTIKYLRDDVEKVVRITPIVKDLVGVSAF